MSSRGDAEALDGADELSPFRRDYLFDDAATVYLDGNSLGRPPRAAVEAVGGALDDWRQRIVGGWRDWIELPGTVGDELAPLLGSDAGQVLVCDQTSVNLYKLAVAGLAASGRSSIASTTTSFPSDLYILEAVANAAGGRLVLAEDEAALPSPLKEDVGLVSVSHVDFKTGRVLDMETVNQFAADAGAFTLWDLSHSAGVMPVDLDGTGADLAVGCTYKYLNGGPGAPAFLYVASRHQARMEQPIHGWFGHADMFGFDRSYVPAPGILRFQVGTPPILSLIAARAGIDRVAAAGIEAIRHKSLALTGYLMELLVPLEPLGVSTTTPVDPESRGGHVAVQHPHAYQIAQALIGAAVVPDYRAPDTVRLAPSPLYTRFVDVWDGVQRLQEILRHETYRDYPPERRGVT